MGSDAHARFLDGPMAQHQRGADGRHGQPFDELFGRLDFVPHGRPSEQLSIGSHQPLGLFFLSNPNYRFRLWKAQFGVYNLTNRVNPYAAIWSENDEGNPVIEEIGLIPLLPNLSFKYAWN